MAVTLTAAAAARVREYAGGGEGLAKLRFGVRKSGCSGFGYVVEYADRAADGDSVFTSRGVEVLVDRASLAVVDGTVIDFRATGLGAMFHFDNPNAAASCGCGESFTTAGQQ